MRNRLKLLSTVQSGDTIVEVLICVAVISLVILATYTTVNGSIIRLEESQERERAVKLAESQIEDLKAWFTGTAFSKDCFSYNGSSISAQTNSPPTNNCVLDFSGKKYTAGTSTGPAYNIKISGPDALGTYAVNITWQGFRQQDKTFLEYRLQ